MLANGNKSHGGSEAGTPEAEALTPEGINSREEGIPGIPEKERQQKEKEALGGKRAKGMGEGSLAGKEQKEQEPIKEAREGAEQEMTQGKEEETAVKVEEANKMKGRGEEKEATEVETS